MPTDEPTPVPITIWRGANDPAVIWEFESAPGVPADLTGSAFALTVAWNALPSGGLGGILPAGTIKHGSIGSGIDAVLVIDPVAGRVTWPYTIAESEMIPHVRVGGVSYVLTRTIAGKTRPWAGGPVIVRSYLP